MYRGACCLIFCVLLLSVVCTTSDERQADFVRAKDIDPTVVSSSSDGRLKVHTTEETISSPDAAAVAESRPPQMIQGPVLYLSGRQAIPSDYSREKGGKSVTLPRQTAPLSMASGDLDMDGIEDLAIGYSTAVGGVIALHSGNIDAFAPQNQESLKAIAEGNFPSPFLQETRVLSSPVRPDFIAIGNFIGDDHPDLVVAERGSRAVYVFAGEDQNRFSEPSNVATGGPITTIAAGDLGHSGGFSDLLICVGGGRSNMGVYAGTESGLSELASYPLNAPASSVLFGDINQDSRIDAAIVSNGRVLLLDSASMRMQQLSLPISVKSLAVGSFIYDRNPGLQLALLDASGRVRFAVHDGFDPRPYTLEQLRAKRSAALNQAWDVDEKVTLDGNLNVATLAKNWHVVECLPVTSPFSNVSVPVMIRTRISDHGSDDVMILDGLSKRMSVISHPNPAVGGEAFAAGQVSSRAYDGRAMAALAMRVNIDGRPGVVSINRGEISPSMMMPLPDPTFTVNRTDDPAPHSPIATACNGVANDCSLREAVLKSNSTGGTDTIMVPAGTFTLTRAKVANDYSGNNGALYVNDSVNIVGAGQNSTIIQAGTVAYNAGTPNGVDMVMAVNEDINPLSNATASISSLTIQNGHNRGAHGNDGDGGCMEFDTGTSGTANLTFTNVALQNCDTTKGNGAGIAIFNFTNPGTGLVTFTNSIIQGNSAVDTTNSVAAGGGGIWVSNAARMSMTGSQVLNNKAAQITPVLPSGNVGGIGGGIYLFSNAPSRQTVIHSSTISGNEAAQQGGGIYNLVNLLVDQGTVIKNNSVDGSGVSPIEGGGLYDNTGENGCPAACSETATLNKVTITGNTASNGLIGSGGGIYHGNLTGAGSLTVTFSRLAGNTAKTSGPNLFEDHSVATVTNNWWGTNAPATTITNSGGTTTFDPYIVLTQNATPSKIRINQSSTLTGDLGHDNHGNSAALTGNLDEIVGQPITFNDPLLGSIPQAQPETLNSGAQATATFNAGSSPGRGSADATVDQAVIGANSNLIAGTSEAGTTVTVNTVGTHNFSVNNTVVIAGVTVAGYNGTFTILSTPTPTTFTYTAPAGLAASGGGTANMGIIVLGPPTITKTFGAATIPINGMTTANFSINNPNVVAINGSFTDLLPAGLQVAATPGITSTCGTVTATAGTGTISFSNGLTPIGTCTISVNITGTVDNQYTNSVQILSTDAGNGNTSQANLTVINPPHIVKAFGATTIPLGGSTSLTLTIDSNSNQNLTINGAAFTDTLPAGLVVANPPGTGGTCTGTITAVAGASSISLAGQSLTPGASCTVIVNVTGTTAGVQNNNVQVTSTNAGTGNTGSASITVVAPPGIAKAFGTPSIAVNASTSLTFTLTNPNTTVALAGVTFSDTLPAGLIISTPNGLTGTCGAGTITATAGSNTISLSGGTIAASGNCSFALNVTGTSPGLKNNTTGSVTSTNGGTGLTASASSTVSKANTTASITSDTPDPSVIGQPVTVNFHVASATGSSPTLPTGNVTVSDGTNNCTASIDSSGNGSCDISFPTVGSKSLTATYAGDTNFNASPASAGAAHTVNKGDVTIVVMSDHNLSITGQSVTFRAAISATSPAVGTPTGTIQFMDGATNIGVAQSIVGGMASISTSTLTAGTHTVTAQYSGDTGFNKGSGTLAGGQTVTGEAEWTGSADSDWNNPANWSTGVVPASTNSAEIPSVGVTNNPVIGGISDITIVDLTIGSGRSLTINNSRTLTINGVLSMNGNDIDDTSGLLSIGSAGSITRASGSVLGTLQKTFSAPQAFIYPVGTAGAFSPVDVNVTNGPGLLSVLAHAGTAPATPPLDATKMLQRYWTLNGNGITADVTFHYLDGDVPGTSDENQYRIFRIITGGTALGFQPDGTNVILDTTANTFKVTSVKNFSDWTAGNPLAPTAAPVSISGRVITASGIPIYQARVSLTGRDGNTVTVLTNPFGYYHFDGIESAQTYVLSATSKQYRFGAQVVTANDEIDDLDLVAQP